MSYVCADCPKRFTSLIRAMIHMLKSHLIVREP